MHRIVIATLCTFALATASGCKNKGNEIDEKTQQDLAARREALLSARKKLVEDRQKLETEIKTIEANGGDSKDLRKKLDDLTEQQFQMMQNQLGEAIAKIDNIEKRAGVAGGGGADSAALAAEVRRLESVIERLEAALKNSGGGGGSTETNTKLLAQMTALAEKCGNSSAPAMIVQTSAPKGANYTRAEVEPLLQRARTAMGRKSLLNSDLPAPAQGLESEATKAMADGDWGKAYLAAAQLVGNIDAVKVDAGFIRNKMSRFNARFQSSKRDEAAQKAATAGLQIVMDKFSNNDHDGANRQLTQMFLAL